jgi:hypothetical protein
MRPETGENIQAVGVEGRFANRPRQWSIQAACFLG